MKLLKILTTLLFLTQGIFSSGQNHPEIYVTDDEKPAFLERIQTSKRTADFVQHVEDHVRPFVDRHSTDPEWIISRLQMYWKTKYERVYVNGMDYSHGEGEAPVPTVRFSGSRDWATDYLQPNLEDVIPYMDDERGIYLQNGARDGKPWEWAPISETGHIIERINEEILELAEEAAFLYWLNGEEKYAIFASDILMKYLEGMHHREPPLTVGNHGNAHLMGLQTFEVIHERIVAPIAVSYDFLYDYLVKEGHDIQMAQAVFRKWADQEIKYGVPGNNWNMMQARYITYLAIALEDDEQYEDGKGQQYYVDQVLNQNSEKQKALKDVLENFDPETAIWPEVAHYSIMVSDDLLEIYCMLDKALNNNLLSRSPILEKAILANFHYLFPNDFTAAYGDAKHARLRFNSLELLIAQYRKYKQPAKEAVMTSQLKRFVQNGAYNRDKVHSLYELFFYEEELMDVPAARSFDELVKPSFYSPNVSWIVQRNGNSLENGMMISKNASLGNHSHANGINIELYARGMVIAPDAAAGVSYWSDDHREYYSRFPAHNTVIVDGVSDYRTMEGAYDFSMDGIYPATTSEGPLQGDYTYSTVTFKEPKTDAFQTRLTGTVRTSGSSGYFVDIFRSSKPDGSDKKHEYIFHSQGQAARLFDHSGKEIPTSGTDELSSKKGDLKGYDYFKEKSSADFADHFYAQFSMPSILDEQLLVNVWMKGYDNRIIFTAMAPHSRAIHKESVPKSLYHQPSPTLIVRQEGEAKSRPFVAIIDAYNEGGTRVDQVGYFSSNNNSTDFVGIEVTSGLRKDFIYNDVEGQTQYSFESGEFSGVYGVMTFEGEQLMSMLLADGKIIQKDGWKIETVQTGTVRVDNKMGWVTIDSGQPFTLTYPVSKKTKNVRFSSGSSVIEGRVFKAGKQKYVQIALPALDNQSFEISY